MSEKRIMDLHAINALHAAGDIDTLAQALRNIITVTDEATSSAQAAARQMQEYVPTTLGKDSIYRALDAAFDAERQAEFLNEPRGLFLEHDDEPYEAEVGDSFRAAFAVIPDVDDWDSLPGAFTAEQRDAFTSAAFDLVVNLYSHEWFEIPKQDTTTRGSAPSVPSGEETP